MPTFPKTRPVLDPPICGNPIVSPVHANVAVGCNQAVFVSKSSDGLDKVGGYQPNIVKMPAQFIGVAMSNYSPQDDKTEQSIRKFKRARNQYRAAFTSSRDGPANISVTVAGSATLSLGHHASMDTVPKPGDWVAFDFGESASLITTDRGNSNARLAKSNTYSPQITTYNPQKKMHKPFGICLSVAVSPRSEITVLLRKDVYFHDCQLANVFTAGTSTPATSIPAPSTLSGDDWTSAYEDWVSISVTEAALTNALLLAATSCRPQWHKYVDVDGSTIKPKINELPSAIQYTTDSSATPKLWPRYSGLLGDNAPEGIGMDGTLDAESLAQYTDFLPAIPMAATTTVGDTIKALEHEEGGQYRANQLYNWATRNDNHKYIYPDGTKPDGAVKGLSSKKKPDFTELTAYDQFTITFKQSSTATFNGINIGFVFDTNEKNVDFLDPKLKEGVYEVLSYDPEDPEDELPQIDLIAGQLEAIQKFTTEKSSTPLTVTFQAIDL